MDGKDNLHIKEKDIAYMEEQRDKLKEELQRKRMNY